MKHLLFIISITFALFNCKAQSPIISIETWDGTEQNNAYYKDVNNFLNQFEGTWLYINGNTSLKINLVKKLQFFNGTYYEDIMVGGYQYIENGVEKVNCLSSIDNLENYYNAEIWGNTILDNCEFLPVDDCSYAEKYLGLGIFDPNSEKHGGDLILNKRIINGQEALKINIEMNYLTGEDPTEGDFPHPSIPWKMNDIVLYKQ